MENNSDNLNAEPKIRKKRKSLKDADTQGAENEALDVQATIQSAHTATLFEEQFAKETKAKREMDEAQALTDSEAEAQFQKYIDSQVNTILPHIPEDPMWRYCWVSTEVSYGDSVPTRLRGGWVLVKWGEIEGFTPEVMNNRSGTMGEIITFNEMALMKIPQAVWLKIMKYNHHTQPLEQEASIRQRLMANVQDSSKIADSEYVSGDTKNLGRETKRENFKGV